MKSQEKCNARNERRVSRGGECILKAREDEPEKKSEKEERTNMKKDENKERKAGTKETRKDMEIK